MPERRVILNLGCGRAVDRSPGVVNVDAALAVGVDMLWDLDNHPWPFERESVDEVRAVQLFEHLADPIGFMLEAHRVLRADGLLRIVGPHWQHENSFTDPTHRRALTLHTFDYWIPGTQLYEQFGYAYGGDVARFSAERIVTDLVDVDVSLRRL